ncbi:MAG: aminotransferase class V-fold PLP-dependent enzyme [Acidobacteriota bacterium]
MIDWGLIRQRFPASRRRVHLAAMVLSSHADFLSRTIDAHRAGLDDDADTYVRSRGRQEMRRFAVAAGQYFGVPPELVAEVGNTTLGLGAVYSGLRLAAGQRILTTDHDFVSTLAPLEARHRRDGTPVDRIRLFDATDALDESAIVQAVVDAVRPETRLVALTWVHSSTGVKIPIAAVSRALAALNDGRADAERVLLSVDGVHGFGVEDETFGSLGCDVFVSGCHKWIYGPRGTGVVYATEAAWASVEPIAAPTGSATPGLQHSPMGVHSYELRWAAADAFDDLRTIGKAAVMARVHGLAERLKRDLMTLPRVRMITPLDRAFSSGVVCFDYDGARPDDVVTHLGARDVVGSVSSADCLAEGGRHVRLSPSLMNDEADFARVLDALRAYP